MTSTIANTIRRTSCRRLLSTSSRLCVQPFSKGPAPPRLPEQEQKLYEELQRSSTGAFSTPRPVVVVNQSPPTSTQSEARVQDEKSLQASRNGAISDADLAAVNARVEATGDGEELHPDIRRGALPEFEGDRNPKTGEIGGPKNEPLRWGGNVDWSYNGRVTDF